MSDYEEKRKRRIEKYRQRAKKHEQLSIDFDKSAKEISSFIPFGQPILVGHHSEARHRRDLDKIHNKMGKSIEHSKTAEYYHQRAIAAENNTAISSDDPEALEKLSKRIETRQALQEKCKALNRLLRKANLSKDDFDNVKKRLAEIIPNKEERLWLLKQVQYTNDEKIIIPGFMLTNNNAQINADKKRLKRLQEARAHETCEYMIGDVRVVENVEMNRLQLFFPDKPDDETRRRLKSYGYRWAPSHGCWQAYLTPRSRHQLSQVLPQQTDEETT